LFEKTRFIAIHINKLSGEKISK